MRFLVLNFVYIFLFVFIRFTAEGTPAMYDSNGILSLYRIHGHDLWTPVLNTKVNKSFNATSLCPRAISST